MDSSPKNLYPTKIYHRQIFFWAKFDGQKTESIFKFCPIKLNFLGDKFLKSQDPILKFPPRKVPSTVNLVTRRSPRSVTTLSPRSLRRRSQRKATRKTTYRRPRSPRRRTHSVRSSSQAPSRISQRSHLEPWSCYKPTRSCICSQSNTRLSS